MTKDDEEFSQFIYSVACREYTLPRDEEASEPKVRIRGNTKIGPVLEVTTGYLQGKYRVEIWIEFMNEDNSHSCVRISHGLSKFVTNLKKQGPRRLRVGSLRNALRRLCVQKRMQVTLQADRKPKKNQKDILLPAHPQKLFLVGKELGLILNQKNIRSLSIQFRRKWSIFFVRHDKLLQEDDGAIEFWSKRLSSERILSTLSVGPMKSWRAQRHEAEETGKDFSFVPMLQEKLFTSELFKVIQDAILLILHYRTMSLIQTVSSSTFITLDVKSMNIPSSIQDWYWEVKIWANDRQFPPVEPIDKSQGSWKDRLGITASCTVACIKHERNIKTPCIGLTSKLIKRKDWSSFRLDRLQSSFKEYFQLIVSRKLFGWKLEKSYTKKYLNHVACLQRFLWDMSGWRNWVQKLLDKQKLTNQPNQTHIMIERGDP